MRHTIKRLAVGFSLLTLPWLARAAVAGSISGVDAMSSTVMQHEQSSFSGIAVRMRLTPYPAAPEFELLPGVEYWRNTTTVQIYDIRSERRDATLGADLRYRFQTHGWSPYLGAGFGIHFLSTGVRAPLLGVPLESHSIMKGGAALMGGLTFPLAGAFDSFVEVKYHGVSDYEQLKLSWGLAYNIQH
jgi:hypothetical protein